MAICCELALVLVQAVAAPIAAAAHPRRPMFAAVSCARTRVFVLVPTCFSSLWRLPSAVAPAWAAWGSWTAWSGACGNPQTRTHTRACTTPCGNPVCSTGSSSATTTKPRECHCSSLLLCYSILMLKIFHCCSVESNNCCQGTWGRTSDNTCQPCSSCANGFTMMSACTTIQDIVCAGEQS